MGVESGSGAARFQCRGAGEEERGLGNVGAVGGLRLCSREREEGGGDLEGMKLTSGSHLSAEEGGGERGVGRVGWLGPSRPKASGGIGGERFYFFLFQTNFQIHFQIEIFNKFDILFLKQSSQ